MTVLNLLVLCRTAEGQEVVRFDTVHQNVVGSFALGHSVFEVDGGFRVFGIQKGLADQSQDIYVSDFDQEGGFVSEATFQTYRQDWMGASSPIVRTAEGFYAGVSRFGVSSILDSLYLYKFNGQGDTVWTRFIVVDTTYLMRGLARTTTGDLLFAGSHQPLLQTEAYVLRTDSTGTFISYHGYAGFDGEDVVEGMDGSWYVCGRGNIGASNGYPVLLRSDTMGNELWRRSDDLYGNYFSLIPTLDSGIVALGYRADGFVEGPLAKVIKYDRAGEEQWMRELYQSTVDEWPCRLYAGFQMADSSYIVAGAVRDTIQGYAGMLFHLDKEGNTLWQRFYTRFQGFDLNHDQIFWDVKPTSDGGLVLTGETNTDDYQYAQLWLLKLDSMGCLVPGCGSVGVEEYTDLFNGKLVVAPNPANEMVSVALDLTEGVDVDGQVRVVLLDASGRLVLEQTVQQNLNQLRATLDVSALPAGTYYLHLRDAKRWLAGSKVVVE